MDLSMRKFWRRIIRHLKDSPAPAEKKPFFTKEIFADTAFEIGEYTYGHPTILHWGEDATLKIGKFCSIAENVKIFLGGNHRADWVTTYPFSAFTAYFPEAAGIIGHPATRGDVVIGNDVWIGYGASVLSGITIGNGAIVGAGAMVTKNIGPYEIWAGNPAVFIRKRFSDATIIRLEQEKWWDAPIEEIRLRIRELCDRPDKEV